MLYCVALIFLFIFLSGDQRRNSFSKARVVMRIIIDHFVGVIGNRLQRVDIPVAPWDRDVTAVASSNENNSTSNRDGCRRAVDSDVVEADVRRATNIKSSVIHDAENSRLTGIANQPIISSLTEDKPLKTFPRTLPP